MRVLIDRKIVKNISNKLYRILMNSKFNFIEELSAFSIIKYFKTNYK